MGTQALLLYVDADFENFDETIARDLEQLVLALSQAPEFIGAELEYVDSTDDTACTLPEDVPIRTLGIHLQVSDRKSNQDVQRRDLQRVRRLIEALSQYSSNRNISFESELDGDPCGGIVGGRVSKSLQVGLIESWESSLGSDL